MRILITGGAGFIGSHLARACVERGAEVVVLDSLRTGREENLEGVDCEFLRGDVCDAQILAKATAGCDLVYHLAAAASIPESIRDPELYGTINAEGTFRVVLTAALGGARVIFTSTCAVYGPDVQEISNEDDPPNPAHPYAVSKLKGEIVMRKFLDDEALSGAIVRLFNVYGPRQDPDSPYAAAVAAFARQAQAGEPLRIEGDGQQKRDFVYIDDVVQALLLVAEKGEGTLNVASGAPISVENLARLILEASGSRSKIERAPAREADVRYSCGDNSRLRALGWEPTVDLAEGLRRTLNEG